MKISLKPLDQQVMLITGASSGIGRATALMAAERGAQLLLVARSDDSLAALADEINARAGRRCAAWFHADVAHRDALQNAASEAIQQFGRIDTWVNDAGVTIYGRLDEVSDDDSRRLFETNFWGVVHGSLIALPYLRQQGGALINVGSEVSDAVVPYQGIYSASKHAVKGFTDALRVEVQQVDEAPVAITLIQPTAVDTPYPQHARNYMLQEPKLPTPMVAPEKVAEAILDAATTERRDVKVGTMAKLNTVVSKVMPSLGDKLSAAQADRQQRDERPREPAGALHAPMAANTNRVRGDGG